MVASGIEVPIMCRIGEANDIVALNLPANCPLAAKRQRIMVPETPTRDSSLERFRYHHDSSDDEDI